MTAFRKKKLKPTKRICLRLKEARESAGLTLEDVATKTKISKKHLMAIEACDFDTIPFAMIYKKNFIRRYAEALGADASECVSQFVSEESAPISPSHPRKTIKSTSFRNLPLVFRLLSVFLVGSLLVVYLGLQIKHIIEPPELVIFGPKDGFVTSEQKIHVYGQAEPNTTIRINGQVIARNGDATFEEGITLSPGINTLIISAQKKHGKTTSQTRHVIFKQAPRFSYTDPPAHRLTP